MDTGSAQLDGKYFLVRRYYKHATSADFWGSIAELYGKVYRISDLFIVLYYYSSYAALQVHSNMCPLTQIQWNPSYLDLFYPGTYFVLTAQISYVVCGLLKFGCCLLGGWVYPTTNNYQWLPLVAKWWYIYSPVEGPWMYYCDFLLCLLTASVIDNPLSIIAALLACNS